MCLCVHALTLEHTHATAFMWRSEGSFGRQVFPSHLSSQGCQVCWPVSLSPVPTEPSHLATSTVFAYTRAASDSKELPMNQAPCLLSYMGMAGTCRVCVWWQLFGALTAELGGGAGAGHLPWTLWELPSDFSVCSISRGIYPEDIVTGPELLMWSRR